MENLLNLSDLLEKCILAIEVETKLQTKRRVTKQSKENIKQLQLIDATLSNAEMQLEKFINYSGLRIK